MDHLSKLENESIYLIREAYSQFKDIGMMWSVGKDSTTLLWLIRKAFYGVIPFPVIHLDTGYKFKEIYEFRDYYAKEWGFDLLVYRNEDAIKRGVCPQKGKLECCTELKTEALKQVVAKNHIKALYLGIRRDEHGVRAKERFFSVRDQDFEWNYKEPSAEIWDQHKTEAGQNEHFRIHPILSWTERDIWHYIERENIPMTNLYFSNGEYRYRSIGCETCCNPIPSAADTVADIIRELDDTKISERSGRAQDKESDYMMQKLRSLGYM